MTKLSPSILAADPLHLGAAARLAKDAGCDELHYDVMDGHFVPNLSYGPALLAAMKRDTDIFYDVHLMLSDPLHYVDAFAKAGADLITVHAEANELDACIARIRELGLRVGVSLKPKTPASVLADYLSRIDRVLLMTVEPGFGGQKLIPEALEKAGQLRAMGFTGDIEADGGINMDNAPQLVQAGIGVLVMGTAFYGASDPQSVARRVHAL